MQPPGPKGMPIIGMMPAFFKEVFPYLRSLQEYGDVVQVPMGMLQLIYILHPDQVAQILVKDRANYTKGQLMGRTKILFGNGLLTSDGDLWKQQRIRMTHSFLPKCMRAFQDPIAQITAKTLDSFTEVERKIDVDMMALTLEITLQLLFGTTSGDDLAKIADSFSEISDFFASPSEFLLRLPTWVPTPGNIRFNRALKDMDSVVHRIVEERREKDSDKKDLLSTLISGTDDDGTTMDTDQLRDEIRTLMLAGHETTALGLSFALWLLAGSPELQETLAKELHSIAPSRPIQGDDLPQLGSVEQVFKEAMRYYPPAPIVTRSPIKEVELGGYTIPAKSNLIIPIWAIHRDKRFFDRPDEFDPSRWTKEMEKDLPRFAYFPFGGGPRICIGFRMAMMEGTLILAEIIRRFHLERLEESLDFAPSFTLRTKKPIRMRLIPRN